MSHNQSILVNCTEARDVVNVTLKKPSMRYIDEFLGLHCAPELIEWRLFPNAKEITESMAAYAAVRKYLWPRWRPDDDSIEVFCIGDGCTPRTGAVFAMRSKWVVYSIDPVLREETKKLPIQRLNIRNQRVEAYCLTGRPHKSLIVAVHSHADLGAAYQLCHGKQDTAVVAMKCCVSQSLPSGPDEVYEDWGVWSPHRTIQIWKSIPTSLS